MEYFLDLNSATIIFIEMNAEFQVYKNVHQLHRRTSDETGSVNSAHSL